jgi:hypothetical protein
MIIALLIALAAPASVDVSTVELKASDTEARVLEVCALAVDWGEGQRLAPAQAYETYIGRLTILKNRFDLGGDKSEAVDLVCRAYMRGGVDSLAFAVRELQKADTAGTLAERK